MCGTAIFLPYPFPVPHLSPPVAELGEGYAGQDQGDVEAVSHRIGLGLPTLSVALAITRRHALHVTSDGS